MSKMRDNDAFSEAEATQRRDEALKRALGMPHKPHKPSKKKKEGRTKGDARRQSAKAKA